MHCEGNTNFSADFSVMGAALGADVATPPNTTAAPPPSSLTHSLTQNIVDSRHCQNGATHNDPLERDAANTASINREAGFP